MPPRKVAEPGKRQLIGIKVAPDGRYLYVTSGTQCLVPKGSGRKCHVGAKPDTVSVFRISPATGALSAKPVQTVATGRGPQMITIAPDGKSAYVAARHDLAVQHVNPAAPADSQPEIPGLGVARTAAAHDSRWRRTARTCTSST